MKYNPFKRKKEPEAPKDLGLDTYQMMAMEFAQFPKEVAKVYPVLGLAGEAGEVANKVKKLLRGDPKGLSQQELADELGDVLWYLAVTAQSYGISLKGLAGANIRKLNDRRSRDQIKGDGDNR